MKRRRTQKKGSRQFALLLIVLVGLGGLIGLTLAGGGPWARVAGAVGQQALNRIPGLAATPGPLGDCDPHRPTFLYGFAALKARLGDKMGDPLECEHSIHVSGDTRQLTTTGYAYYRKFPNEPAFTNGYDHWALTQTGLVYWAGDVIDPPGTAVPVSASR
ncbi:MAG TPA: hypothetical protein VF937_16815 [Chloroflexota bacterium]